MTQYSKTTLKTFFETGDVPTGTDYANLIDSCLNLVETSSQSMAGSLLVTELVTPQISAGNGFFSGSLNVTGTLSAANFAISNLSVTTLSTNTINATGNIVASAGAIYGNSVRLGDGLYLSTGIVSAAGSTQATAAPLSLAINLGAGVVDGQTTGFILPANKTGFVQYIINGGASANLWPCIGGQINALASNAAFSMAANTQYQILHTKASGYAVK